MIDDGVDKPLSMLLLYMRQMTCEGTLRGNCVLALNLFACVESVGCTLKLFACV